MLRQIQVSHLVLLPLVGLVSRSLASLGPTASSILKGKHDPCKGKVISFVRYHNSA